MIRALRAWFSRAGLPRLVAVVVLVAVVGVLLHAAAHHGGLADSDHDECVACAASTCAYACDTVHEPQLAGHLGPTDRIAPPDAVPPSSVEPGCLHAPRGPPSLA